MKIYHNPRCTKSRNALKIIQQKNLDITIIEYLKDPISEEELESIIKLLKINIEKIIRKNEAIFKTEFKGKNLNPKQWIKILCKNPKLIQRPIITTKNSAIIGRDENELNAFLTNL